MKRLTKTIALFSGLSLALLGACSSDGAGSADAGADESAETIPAGDDAAAAGGDIDYPNGDIELLIGFSAGGGTDSISRMVAKLLNEEGLIEENFVIENMPGAGGGLALMELKNRSDDPQVLLSMPDTGDPVWEGTIDATVDDFTLLAQLATDSIFIVVNSAGKYSTFEELVAAFQEDTGSVNVGLGADVYSEEGQLWYEIGQAYDFDFDDINFIPQDGGAEITTSLLGGHIDVTAINTSSIAGYIESGDFNPLAVLSGEPNSYFPDVPTLDSLGVDHIYERSRGIWAGGDIDPAVVTFWEDTFEALVATDSWKEFLETNMLEGTFKRSAEYDAYVRTTAEKLVDFKEISR